jgi:nitroreductase
MTTLLSQRRAAELLAPDASLFEVVRWAVRHATAAPSELNTQPWSFRASLDSGVGAARIELGLDRTRLLPHLDPDAREAVLACGAALLNLRLALRGAELGSAVQLCPDPAQRDLLAVVTVRGRTHERPEDRALREAILERGTRRTPFERGEVPTTLLDHAVAEGAYEGALVSVLDPDEALALHALDIEACAREAVDQAREEERAHWMRPNTSGADDGVTGRAHGLGLVASLAEPHHLRHGDSHVAADELRAGATDPCVLVIGSVSDDRDSLLRAGAGLERLLLALTAAGVTCRFVNESLRQPDLRFAAGRVAGLDHPQVVLHLGYGAPDTVTPRRPVDDVLVLNEVTSPATKEAS